MRYHNMEILRQRFGQSSALRHYGDDVYLLDDVSAMEGVLPLTAGREIVADKVVFLLCRKGGLRLRLNYHDVVLTDGCLLIALPGMIIDTREVSPDLEATTMLMAERFTGSLDIGGGAYRTLLAIRRQPMVKLDGAMLSALIGFVGMVRGLLDVPSHPNMDRVMHRLFEAWFFGMSPYLHGTASQRVATVAELHTEAFLRLVERNYNSPHQLEWYASQLNVSAKRLGICVKQASGRTPSEWIDRHRLLEAERLLRSGSLSVKEVASSLGFPNQSAFGTWFRRHTGLSPKGFKG